jgi:hypothetical protein
MDKPAWVGLSVAPAALRAAMPCNELVRIAPIGGDMSGLLLQKIGFKPPG